MTRPSCSLVLALVLACGGSGSKQEPDAGQPDGGQPDAGPDGGLPDGGQPSGPDGVWISATGPDVTFDVAAGKLARFNIAFTFNTGTGTCTVTAQVKPDKEIAGNQVTFPFVAGGVTTQMTITFNGALASGSYGQASFTVVCGSSIIFGSSGGGSFSARNRTALGEPLPDLVATSVSTASTRVPPGGKLTVANALKNQGGHETYAFGVSLRLSRDGGVSDDDPSIGSRSVFGLKPDAGSSSNTSATIPGTVPIGDYYVCMLADSLGFVPETNEANNTACTATTINVDGPDVLVVDLSSGSASIAGATSMTATWTVKNQAALEAAASTIAFRLSPNAIYGDSDDLFMSAATAEVPIIAGGATASGTATFTVPASIAAGDYYLCAKADSGSILGELDEANNALCTAGKVTAAPGDLVVSALSMTAAAVAPGATFSVSSTTKNDGASRVAGSTTAFRLSTDAAWSADDVAVTATRAIAALDAAAVSTGSTSLVVPADTAPGAYYVCASADSAGAVAEANEANNSTCTSGTIQVAKADLQITSVSTNSTNISAGQSFSVSWALKNNGPVSTGGSFHLGFRISADNVPGNGDDLASTTEALVTTRGAGEVYNSSTSVSVPASLAAGTYYVCAVADARGVISESDEANNGLCTASTVTVTPPDLAVSSVYTPPVTVYRGATITISSGIDNLGNAAAGAFQVGYVLTSNGTLGDGDDVALAERRSIATMNGYGYSYGETVVTIPASMTPGTYYVAAIADVGGAITESNEANNTKLMGSPITVQ